MKSILGGLAKGLMANSNAAPAQSCSSDPNAYQQQQQQYNQQLQQYQYQLQQYNYQQQMSQYNGMPAPLPPIAPTPCQQNSSQNTCAAPPAQPSPAGCPNGTWRPITTQQSNGANCTTSWQCVPGGGGAIPTAELSCNPNVADVGMSVAIAYSCTNATGSAGSGFDTDGATSGATTTVIANPPAGTNTATFGIVCTNQNLVGRAECKVQIGRPSIILVANPRIVQSGASSTIGWITSGMRSCVVSSPDMPAFTAENADNTSVNGMATTSPLTSGVRIRLNCTTVGGGVRVATTTVSVIGTPDPVDTDEGSVTVSSTIDGSDEVTHGTSTRITWSVRNMSADASVSLWLFDNRLGQTTGLIARDLGANGTHTWSIPTTGSSCPADSANVCATDLVADRSYSIEAAIYTPRNAYLGGLPNPSLPQPTYLDFGFTEDFLMVD